MRVRFADRRATDQRALEELQGRSRVLFEEASSGRDVAWWRASVRDLHPDLSVELEEDGLVVLCPERRSLTLIAELVAGCAPPGMRVLSGSPARSTERVLAHLKASTGLDFSGASLRVGFVRGHLLEVLVRLPGGRGDASEQRAAEDLVWGLLGERTAEEWIGEVEVVPAPRRGPLRVLGSGDGEPALGPEDLLATVSAARDGVWAELPAEPLFRTEPGAWTLFELEPSGSSDLSRQDDLVLCTTCLPELIKCYLEEAPFSSVRFSRHGERFFCLKYEARGSPEERLAFRDRVEAALERELIRKAAGCVVGNGLGLRYAYVDLAFHDVAAAVDIVGDAARAHQLPSSSWLLPLDDEWGEEWVEVWPDASPPPGLAT